MGCSSLQYRVLYMILLYDASVCNTEQLTGLSLLIAYSNCFPFVLFTPRVTLMLPLSTTVITTLSSAFTRFIVILLTTAAAERCGARRPQSEVKKNLQIK